MPLPFSLRRILSRAVCIKGLIVLPDIAVYGHPLPCRQVSIGPSTRFPFFTAKGKKEIILLSRSVDLLKFFPSVRSLPGPGNVGESR